MGTKTVDLSKVKVELLDGSIIEHNVAKELAQVIFQSTQSIEEHSFSLDLYKNPVVELTDKNRAIIEKYIKQYFKAFVQIAIEKLFND